MADTEDDEAFLYGDTQENKKDPQITEKKEQEITRAEEDVLLKEDEIKKEPEDKEAKENEPPGKDNNEDDAKEAGELSNEDDEDDDDDDDDDDDVQVTIGEINTSGTAYGAPYATPVNWNFKGGPVSSATKGTPAAGSKHLDLNAEGTVNGVGIYEFDMESVEEKPWRKPGADITDYFNYGFTEDTWKQYCEKQRRMRMELNMQKKIFTHHAGAPIAPGQPDMAAVMGADARVARKAGPPPERRMEGSIDVIGAVGSRVESRRHQDEEMIPPHMMGDGIPPDARTRGMPKRGFPGNQNMPPGMPPVAGPPLPYLPTSEHAMGPPPHVGGPPESSMSGPPNMPMNQNMPPRFPPGGPPGGPGGIPGMMPPGMPQPPPGVNQPPGFPQDGVQQDASGFPGRGGPPGHGRGRGRGFLGMPGMPHPDFPPGMDERGAPRLAFEDGMPHFFPGDHMAFPQMMGPPPHGLPWDPTLGRGFLPNFRDQFPVGLPRPGGESPGRPRSDEDSEYASSEDERRREREHKKRDKEKDRERSREHRERTRDRHSDRDRSPRRERDRDRRDRDRDRESRRHRDRDKDRDKGSERDREKREERSSRRERSKDQKKRHKGSSEAQSTDGQEEGEVVSSRRKSRRTRESKQQEVKAEPSAEQEEGQLPSP